MQAVEVSERERRAVRKMRAEPTWFIENALGADLWAKQREIVNAVRDNARTVVRSCFGIGKSFIAARIVVAYLLLNVESIVATTAPTGHQVKQILWHEIRRAHGSASVPIRSTPLTTEWVVRPGWHALGLSVKDPQSFQGLHAPSGKVLVVIDEAAGVDREIWEASSGALASEGARLLAIGNPLVASGPFYDEFKQGRTAKIHVSAFHTPNFTKFGITRADLLSGEWEAKIAGRSLPMPWLVTPAWAADMIRRYGEKHPLVVAKVDGEFPDSSSDRALLPLTLIEAAKQRDEEELPPGEPVELGVDVARFGSDLTCIAVRRGSRVRILSTSAKEDTMQTTGRVIQARRETKATSIKVDDIGLGGGVTDRLRELKEPVVPINVSESAVDSEKFANLRAELWWSIRERAQDGRFAFDPDSDLEEELASIEQAKTRSDGRIAIEPKDETKKRLGRSPDRGDAVMLAFGKPGGDAGTWGR